MLTRIRALGGATIALLTLIVLAVAGLGVGIANATVTSTALAAADKITFDRSYADGTNGSALNMYEFRFDRGNDGTFGTSDTPTYINEKAELRGVSNGNTVLWRIKENPSVSQTNDWFEITNSSGTVIKYRINQYAMPVAPVYATVGALPTTGLQEGAQAFVSATHLPVWWDGSAWRDAAGNAV
jgi:hypothetical protein